MVNLGNATRQRLPHVGMTVDQSWDENMVCQADDFVGR